MLDLTPQGRIAAKAKEIARLESAYKFFGTADILAHIAQVK